MPFYSSSNNNEVLDVWLDQLDTYFELYGYNSEDKVTFVQFKLTGDALA